MALASIVTSLKAALQTTAGINPANVRIPAPEVPLTGTDLPAIVADVDSFVINPGALSVWDYPVDIYYLHAERGTDIATDLTAVYPKPKAMVDALNAHATLAGQIYGTNYADPSGEIGVIAWRGRNYTGCVLHTIVKEKYATTFNTSA